MVQRDDIDAERFAESLDALDEGRNPHVDPFEDPGLALDLEAAQALRAASAAVELRATYRERSRALLLQSMRGASGGKQAAPVPFYRRWSLVLAPVAAAAAAAAITVAVLGGSSSAPTPAPTVAPEPEQLAAVAPEPAAPAVTPSRAAAALEDDELDELAAAVPAAAVPNLTIRSVVEELDRITMALETINERAGGGELVDTALLRTVTEHTSKLAAQIDSDPDSITEQAVITYIKAAATGRIVLAQAVVSTGNEAALFAAQQAAQDGVEVASNYFALRTN